MLRGATVAVGLLCFDFLVNQESQSYSVGRTL